MAILKLFHVLFVISWLGSLLTLTCFLGYLVKEAPLVQERLSKIAKKMYLAIDLPSMILTVGLGLILLFFKEDINWKAPWLHMKLTFAFLLIVCDLVTGRLIVKERRAIWGYRCLHALAILLLAAILSAIYILKLNAC